MNLIDKIRGLFGGDRHHEPTAQQRADQERARRAMDSMSRRR